MKFPRVAILTASVLAVLSVGLVGCGGRGSSGRAASSAQARAETAAVIRATERQRLRALLEHDFDTANKLHAEDFELINPLGERVSREDFIDSGAAFAYKVWKPISPIRVRVHGDSAVIRYESEIEISGIRGHYWHTDLYEKRNGQWKIVWSQTTGAP
jgi:ketosteroid isomerase-like protein